MDLKQEIIDLIAKSGIENKEVVVLLDEVRKIYHNPKNVGDKVLNQKEHHSVMEAEIYGKSYTISNYGHYVFYKGGWRKIYRDNLDGYFIDYLGLFVKLELKRKNNIGA